MKKLAIMLCAMCVLAGTTYAADNQNFPNKKLPPNKEQMEQARKAHEAAFDQKLGLTEVQKLKAKELRKAGFEKMKLVFEQLKAKKQEAEKINNSQISKEEKEQQLAEIDKSLAELKKQASTIRKQNMKDFESILTKEQKKILKQMKKEGRKKFEHDRNLPKPPCPKFPEKF